MRFPAKSQHREQSTDQPTNADGVRAVPQPLHLSALRCRGPHEPSGHTHHLPEVAISATKPASWAYAESFVAEDDVLLRARARADELGCPAVGNGAGALLSLLAAAVSARAVVEVGTGTGVSGVWLLRGMPADGVLTTIDAESEHQRAAKEAFAEAGVRPQRARSITGRALDVMPRLTDGAYDMVVLDGDKAETAAYIEQAVRLLRAGGLLAVTDALGGDRVADPAQRDATTTGVREVGRAVRDDERLLPAMVPTSDGLLLAVRR